MCNVCCLRGRRRVSESDFLFFFKGKKEQFPSLVIACLTVLLPLNLKPKAANGSMLSHCVWQ